MSIIRITKEFTFEMAHSLEGHRGKCENIHGHSYHLAVTIIGKPIKEEGSPSLGMVCDFTEVKRIVKENILDEFDHALLLKDTHPLAKQFKESATKLILTSYQPTCENMLIDFVSRVSRWLTPSMKLYSMKLRETSTSYAEWVASDNEYTPHTLRAESVEHA